MKRSLLYLVLLGLIGLNIFGQQDFSVQPPPLLSKSAILIDMTTGDVLYEKDADLLIPPASMTKVMTLNVIYRLISLGEIDYNDIVPVSYDADWRNLPPYSSNMRLEQHQTITLRELMLGLAVSSGNDAAIALAEYAAGSVSAFVDMMNKEAQRLGFSKLHFDDPSGLSADNLVTAREFAMFCKTYIETYPQALTELHSVPDFTYPMAHNGPTSLRRPKTKSNTNLLIGRYEGIDGLKTGYIDESGYNIAVTAERDGRRLLAVLMGAPGTLVGIDGLVNRAMDAALLLDYGFYSFTSVSLIPPVITPLPVYNGDIQILPVEFLTPEVFVLERWMAPEIEWHVTLPDGIIGTLEEGDILGTLSLRYKNRVLREFPLSASQSVNEASGGRKFLHWFALLFKDKSNYFGVE